MKQSNSATAVQESPLQTGKTYTAKAYSARSAASGLAPTTIQRRNPRPQDVQIDILYCGVCHSDLHTVRNQWEAFMPTVYPCTWPGAILLSEPTRFALDSPPNRSIIPAHPLSIPDTVVPGAPLHGKLQ